ncbi:uncharacterized protein LOC106384073 [Brassica napus]|uniref:uncharacterized protein LOC106384073 n=1 Tax=Brassica napus TaxID=3708 RepID=UPI002078F633|nr:uncharacterized protein LOC106384073 [Brassica napus]
MVEILGSRGVIDMGISNEATVAEAVLGVRRRRRHRTELLNAIESEMVAVKERLRENVEDITPKYAFITWLAMLDRLTTMDRVARWIVLMLLVLFVKMLQSPSDRDKKRSFCLRYGFQTIIYVIWRERNKITHGESPLPMNAVKKLIDKGVRNKLSLLRSRGGKGMESALQYWFSTRT